MQGEGGQRLWQMSTGKAPFRPYIGAFLIRDHFPKNGISLARGNIFFKDDFYGKNGSNVQKR